MKKLIAILLSGLMLAIFLCSCADTSPASDASKLMDEMLFGWNLGNTLDAPDGENSWGQPTTTKEMIDTLKELGVKTVRVPVSWGKHVDENNVIDADWMNRVQEIVDYVIDNGMYCIINSHHDNDYYYPSEENYENAAKFMGDIWLQVAERFKDYDYHLIFESMNEPRLAGTNYEWWLDTNSLTCIKAADNINDLNQLFVDTVRATGGNNADRYLSVPAYCASPYNALDDTFELPMDTTAGRLMISVHAYTPYDLVMGDSYDKVTFGASEKGSIDDFINKLYDKYVRNGIPVYIGETGCINKNNPDARYDWACYFMKKAREADMIVCVWDNGADTTGNESYAFFDRYNLKIYDNSKCVYDGFMKALKDAR